MGNWIIKGKYKNRISEVENQFQQCKQIFYNLERKIANKEDVIEGLNNEMSKKMRAGTYTTLEKYLEVYPEARNYQHILQPLTYSVKPSSTTTPYRLCSNSSLQGSNGPNHLFLDEL